jgi:ribosome biogenesis GTPase
VLPRRTRLARRVAGRRDEEQVVAANVDTVLVVMGLDADFNTRRVERYLALAHAGGVRPVVVLNKADLCTDVEARRAAVAAVAPGAPILTTSLAGAGGHEAVEACLEPRRTVALLGSSGVGKSTLLNRLAGADVQRTAAVRAYDSRGRHTTSFAQLFRLPAGALAVDTPGLRELALTDDAEAGLGDAFDDVAAVAAGCRFRDCRHDREPGCAVRAAVDSGALPDSRFASYLKLRGEMESRQRRRGR